MSRLKFWVTVGLIVAFSLVGNPVLAGSAVNVNTATAEQLAEALDGVGLAKAQRIVEYRQAHGPFKHRDELILVKGIGMKTVDRNRDYIQLSERPSPVKKKS